MAVCKKWIRIVAVVVAVLLGSSASSQADIALYGTGDLGIERRLDRAVAHAAGTIAPHAGMDSLPPRKPLGESDSVCIGVLHGPSSFP